MKITSGQVAVIMGGAGGIGFGLAEALAARGVRLVLADIREEALESATDALWSSGAEVIFVRTDVSDGDAVERLPSGPWNSSDGSTCSATAQLSYARARRCGNRTRKPGNGCSRSG